jgi:hypothetical protein
LSKEPLMTTSNMTSKPDESQTDHEPPGGSTVNRVASVATSAALGGAATGAMVGAIAGPIGAAVGAAVGAVAAGIAGNAVFSSVDADVEQDYWQNNFNQRPYVGADADFNDYGPAYGHGVRGFVDNPDKHFDEVEGDLSRSWPQRRGNSTLTWEHARHASRDAWDRARDGAGRPQAEPSGVGHL